MDERVRKALDSSRTIDITTTGRRSGQPRRIEIWFHNLDGRLYITGLPGERDWYANLRAHPQFIFHLKEGIRADLPAHAVPIENPARKREVLTGILGKLNRMSELNAWVLRSPLVEVVLDDA